MDDSFVRKGSICTHNKLVPKDKVIEDMNSDDGDIRDKARAYYLTHYATPEEREQLNKENRDARLILILICGTYLALMLSVILYEIVMIFELL